MEPKISSQSFHKPTGGPEPKAPQFCKIWSSHRSVCEDSGLLGCETVSMADWSWPFEGSHCLLCSLMMSGTTPATDTASHLRRPKTSPQSCLYRHSCYFWSILILHSNQCPGLRRSISLMALGQNCHTQFLVWLHTCYISHPTFEPLTDSVIPKVSVSDLSI